jgi:glucose/arabinose dehydrogenase
MKPRTKVVLAALLGASLLGGLGAARWWRRQHTVDKLIYRAPEVTNTVPLRLRLVPVAVGFDRPTDIQFVPGDGTRAVVLEQGGHARLVDFGPALKGGAPAVASAAPLVLDLWVRALSEMGLLGLAFHPHYAETATLYVYYDPWIHTNLRSRIAEFKLPLQELGKHTAVETRVLLELEQSIAVHQGGQVAFGPDGKLYVGFGDGGTANDPSGNAQNLGSLKGKLLRLDVDGRSLAPDDNPFVKLGAGARPEVWAYGLRNPWRFSFDSAGHAIVGDVGQEAREEVDLVTSGDNLGWNLREGAGCSQTSPHCPVEGLIDPIFDYDRTVGTCVIGGFVATGARVPAIEGKYVFADYVRGRIWGMTLPSSAPAAGTVPTKPKVELLGEWPRLLSTFGRDSMGNMYVADQATGEVLALMALE